MEELVFKNEIENNQRMVFGTNIAVKFKGGLIIACTSCILKPNAFYSRKLENNILMNKSDKDKVFRIAENIYCVGNGVFADIQMLMRYTKANLYIQHLQTNRPNQVITAATLMRNFLQPLQGALDIHLIIAGIDIHGANIISMMAHGSTDNLPYICIGNSHPLSSNIFDLHFRPDMKEEEVLNLVRHTLRSSVLNDLGTNGYSHVVVMNKVEVRHLYWSYEDLGISRPIKSKMSSVILGLTEIISSRILPDFNEDDDDDADDDVADQDNE